MPKRLYLYITILFFLIASIATYTYIFSESFEKNDKELFKATWEILEKIEFVEKEHDAYGLIKLASASDSLRKRSGKEIELSGFVIPIGVDMYAISKNMMHFCYFCGVGGPESMAKIKFKDKTPKLKTDQYITIRGKFKINETDADEWTYRVEKAVIVKELSKDEIEIPAKPHE